MCQKGRPHDIDGEVWLKRIFTRYFAMIAEVEVYAGKNVPITLCNGCIFLLYLHG